MTRASFLKSLFVASISPKIISELDLTTKSVAEHKEVVRCFGGIVEYIESKGQVFEYNPSSFTMSDFKNTIEQLSKAYVHNSYYIQKITQ